MISGITKEHARRGSGTEFVWHSGRPIGETQTTENFQVGVGRRHAEQHLVWCDGAAGLARPMVE